MYTSLCSRTAGSGLIREVSLIQRWLCTQLCKVGTADSVLYIEAQGSLYMNAQMCVWPCSSLTPDLLHEGK